MQFAINYDTLIAHMLSDGNGHNCAVGQMILQCGVNDKDLSSMGYDIARKNSNCHDAGMCYNELWMKEWVFNIAEANNAYIMGTITRAEFESKTREILQGVGHTVEFIGGDYSS